jgi:serine/threonine protein kinase/thiol-disulfide isomerase/thioredoxin
MAVQSILEFRELVAKSGLLDETLLEQFFDQSQPPSPGAAAKALIEKGLLTRFQATMLLAGKYRGLVLGPYKLLKQIGQGGMGVVYLAEHVKLHRRVALKILPQKDTQDRLALERFYREARAVAALDHPNIVRAYDVGEHEGVHYLAMEYVPGVNLQTHLDKKGPLPWRAAVAFIGQACLGLAHAHQRGLIHRDIKPGNLLVDRQGTLKILDLGLARCFRNENDNLTAKFAQNEELTGSLDYMAPEVARGEQAIDIRSDIYSLGLTLYALVTGKPPYEGTPAQKLLFHQMRELPPLHEVQPEVPPGLSAVVARMIAKSPEARYPTPSEVLADLAPWLPQGASPALSAVRLQGGGTQAMTATVPVRSGDTEVHLPSPTAVLPQAIVEDAPLPAQTTRSGRGHSRSTAPNTSRVAPAATTRQIASGKPQTTAVRPQNPSPPKAKPAAATPTPAKAAPVAQFRTAHEQADTDEEDDLPRRKGKTPRRRFKAKKAPLNKGVLVGLVLGLGSVVLVVPLVVVGVVYALSSGSQTPNVAYAASGPRPPSPSDFPTPVSGYTDTQKTTPEGPPGAYPPGSGLATPPWPGRDPGAPGGPAPGPSHPSSSGGQPPAVGMPAPDIDGEDLDGACFRLSDYRGSVVLLDFWGFWCPHCRNMIPQERALVTRMRGRPFALIGVNSDRDPAKLRADLAAHQVNWRSFKNVRSDGGESISKAWAVTGWPTLYLIDHNGVIRERWIGAPHPQVLETKIEELVREAEAARERS